MAGVAGAGGAFSRPSRFARRSARSAASSLSICRPTTRDVPMTFLPRRPTPNAPESTNGARVASAATAASFSSPPSATRRPITRGFSSLTALPRRAASKRFETNFASGDSASKDRRRAPVDERRRGFRGVAPGGACMSRAAARKPSIVVGIHITTACASRTAAAVSAVSSPPDAGGGAAKSFGSDLAAYATAHALSQATSSTAPKLPWWPQ